MNAQVPLSESSKRPSLWSVILGFAIVYVSWGTTYLAIRTGVHDEQLPPALFGGTRVALAGGIVLAFLRLRGESILLGGRELVWVILSGILLFVCGNGLISVGEKTVESGLASVLVATTPLWMAVMETFWPGGDRLSARGWLGLLVGLGGVVLLLAHKLRQPNVLLQEAGPFLVLGSALFWALGSLVVRHRPRNGAHLAAAAYQMIIGGTLLTLIGLILGEVQQLTPERFTLRAGFVYLYLLIVGSLMGFLAFNWLLGHVPATQVGTYAYVNPLIAVLVGWRLGGEEITLSILAGMVVILAGVALVRGASARKEPAPPPLERSAARGLTGFWQNLTAGKQSKTEEKL